MTPHGCLEDMDRLERIMGDHLDINFDPKLWAMIRPLLRDAVAFDYGSARPSHAHVGFGIEMVERELFQLPFGTVFMTAQCLPQSAILARKAGLDDKMAIITFGPSIVGDGERLNGLPIMSMALHMVNGETTISWRSIVKAEAHRSRTTGKQWGEEDFEKATQKALNFTLGAVTMLMSKEVETKVIPTPARLNREREKKGKLPIPERHIVRIKSEYRKAHQETVETGERSSPKMHWRRGHWRTIREDFVVPVAPTIVNAVDGVKPMAKRYEFGKKALNEVGV